MKPFYLCILRCADDSLYVGHTDDLDVRMAQHSGGYGHTRDLRPLEVVYAADFVTREEALSRELQIKKWSRAKKDALIAGDWKRVSDLAKCYAKHGPPKARGVETSR